MIVGSVELSSTLLVVVVASVDSDTAKSSGRSSLLAELGRPLKGPARPAERALTGMEAAVEGAALVSSLWPWLGKLDGCDDGLFTETKADLG